MTFKKTLSSFLNTKEVQFVIAFGGIYISYLQYGVIQERLYNSNYGSIQQPSPRFTFPSAIISLQMLFALLISATQCYMNKTTFVCTYKQSFQLGAYNFVALFTANQALKVVSYPFQALTKSCKILSVLLVGFSIGGQKFTQQQFICGGIITLGIFIFNFFDGKQSNGETSQLGVLLLVVSLFCDGLLASVQTKLNKETKITNWEMMFHISIIGFIISFIVGLSSFSSFNDYLLIYPSVLQDLVTLALLGSIGQCFIFYCINKFSPRVCSIITTTRKFFTVLYSILLYGHDISQIQWLAIGLIGLGVCWELYQGSKKSSKSK